MSLLTPVETVAVLSCGAGNLCFLVAGALAWRLWRRA